MADLSDVETALAEFISAVLYPSGVPSPGQWPDSIIGAPVRVLRGWPIADVLDTDIAAGRCQASVMPVSGQTRNTTRYELQPSIAVGVPTLTASVSGQTVTFAGASSASQVAGILAGGAFGTPYTYRLTANDTPSTVAVAFAAAIPGAASSGATVTLPGSVQPVARVVADSTATTEQQRQEQTFRMSFWSPTPVLRDALCSAIGNAFAPIRWIPLPDSSSGLLRYRSSYTDDVPAKAALWRRDLAYSVEYATFSTETVPCLLFGITNLDPGTVQTSIIS
jgi:hypothetical protein